MLGHAGEDLFDERQTLLHFADANPNSRIDVAIRKHRHVVIEEQGLIGRVGELDTGIEIAP